MTASCSVALRGSLRIVFFWAKGRMSLSEFYYDRRTTEPPPRDEKPLARPPPPMIEPAQVASNLPRQLHLRDAVPEAMTDVEKARFAEGLDALERMADAAAAAAGQSSGGVADFYTKESVWKERVKSKTEELKRDLECVALSDCTFTPVVNRRPPLKQSASLCREERSSSTDNLGYSTAGARITQQDDVCTMLHGLHVNKLANQAIRKKKLEEDTMAECSFKPNVVHSPWIAHVVPRYLDPQPNTKGLSHGERLAAEAAAECTGKPVINDHYHATSVEHYTSVPVHEAACTRRTTDNDVAIPRWYDGHHPATSARP